MPKRYKFCNRMCNLTCKKALLLGCGTFVIIIFTCYGLFFHHGPPEEILQANKGNRQQIRHFAFRDEQNMNELEKQVAIEEKKAIALWENFIKSNGYVSIGEIYDNCDEKDRIMVGKTIILPDVRWGGIKGVKSRTFINTTFESEVAGGTFGLEVKYNGKDLYSRSWELCTLDEDYENDRVIYCPFNPGDYTFVKDRQIPIYLPKGRYQTKGWIKNQMDEIILCGFSDFSL